MADSLLSLVTAYANDWRERTRNGTTVSDVAQIVVGGMEIAIAWLDPQAAPGDQKKSQTVEVALWLFDEFADLAVPTLVRPVWWIARPALRSITAALAGGAVEQLLPLIRGSK
jgi:hypothetical protein